MIDISILNSWISNFPDSSIDSHQAFHIVLVYQPDQPLFSLKAEPSNPLQHSAKGHKPVSTEKRLCSKHFAYKEMKCSWCAICYNMKTSEGKHKDTKTTTFCRKCEMYLCPGSCFEKCHTKSKYWQMYTTLHNTFISISSTIHVCYIFVDVRHFPLLCVVYTAILFSLLICTQYFFVCIRLHYSIFIIYGCTIHTQHSVFLNFYYIKVNLIREKHKLVASVVHLQMRSRFSINKNIS